VRSNRRLCARAFTNQNPAFNFCILFDQQALHNFCCRYHYCVDPQRLLLISPFTFLTSAVFSVENMESVYLLWSGSNYDKSPIMRQLEMGIQKRMLEKQVLSRYTVDDRFDYISRRTGRTTLRPSSMNSFQNVLGIIYSGYSVGCSGFAELYSLGNLNAFCNSSAFKFMNSLQVYPS
jgi:hypothetical protein